MLGPGGLKCPPPPPRPLACRRRARGGAAAAAAHRDERQVGNRPTRGELQRGLTWTAPRGGRGAGRGGLSCWAPPAPDRQPSSCRVVCPIRLLVRTWHLRRARTYTMHVPGTILGGPAARAFDQSRSVPRPAVVTPQRGTQCICSPALPGRTSHAPPCSSADEQPVQRWSMHRVARARPSAGVPRGWKTPIPVDIHHERGTEAREVTPAGPAFPVPSRDDPF